MAGYSGTPLPKKLGIKDGHRVALVRAPLAFDDTLGELPAGVVPQAGLAGKAPLDVIVALPTGLVDNKVCAIDETWSGLRLVSRLAYR